MPTGWQHETDGMILSFLQENSMKQRPLSISIIALVLMAAVLINICQFAFLLTKLRDTSLPSYAMPSGPMMAWGILSLCIVFACVIGFLCGANWSRWVYVAVTICDLETLAISIIKADISLSSYSSVILLLTIRFLILLFLFRPAANLWFEKEKAVSPDA
jgi:hypothetical protein